mmetsp:Transcript_13696/g.38590  ORF Transcript_13696/g.38590 Transcript_13696/m.38590 type:complete len:382 (+) Transcript_13696:1062-2207(+)
MKKPGSITKAPLQSPHVPHVPSFRLHVLDHPLGLGAGLAPLLLDNGMQDEVDVLRHVLVPANVQRSLLLPDQAVELLCPLLDQILNVDLLRLVPRERAVQHGQHIRLLPAHDLVLVDEVLGPAPAPKVKVSLPEPSSAHRGLGLPLLQEPPEGGKAGAWADHDDGGLRLLGQLEVRLPDENGDLGRVWLAPGEPSARYALVVPSRGRVAFHQGARDVDALGVLERGGGDAVEPGLQLWGDPGREDAQARLGARESLEDLQQRPQVVQNVAPVLVPPLLAREMLEPGLLLWVGGARRQRQQGLLPRRGLQVQEVGHEVPDRHGLPLEHQLGELGPRLGRQLDEGLAVVIQALESLRDQLGRVAGEDAHVVPRLVRKVGPRDV